MNSTTAAHQYIATANEFNGCARHMIRLPFIMLQWTRLHLYLVFGVSVRERKRVTWEWKHLCCVRTQSISAWLKDICPKFGMSVVCFLCVFFIQFSALNLSQNPWTCYCEANRRQFKSHSLFWKKIFVIDLFSNDKQMLFSSIKTHVLLIETSNRFEKFTRFNFPILIVRCGIRW